MGTVYRNILFVLFVVLAAPLEYHLRWFLDVTQKDKSFFEAINGPLVSGALFFYSIIVVVEAVMRIETHPTGMNRPATKALKISCWLLVVPFVLYLTHINAPVGGWWIAAQWVTAILSFAVATTVHYYMSKLELVTKGA